MGCGSVSGFICQGPTLRVFDPQPAPSDVGAGFGSRTRGGPRLGALHLAQIRKMDDIQRLQKFGSGFLLEEFQSYPLLQNPTFFRVSCRPSTNKGAFNHEKPGFPKSTLEQAGILSRG